jgi:hypothetical protein
MTGNVVDRLSVNPILSTTAPILLNDSLTEITATDPLLDQSYAITIATTLAFTVGIIQVV